MNEIARILAKAAADRTESELEYLETHAKDFTDEQTKQLADEAEAVAQAEEENRKAIAAKLQAESPIAKNIGAHVYKQFDVEIKELKNGHLEAIINSGQEDRHGEILDMKGLDIKTYMTNPVLAFAHDYGEMSVGKTHKLTKSKDGSLNAEFSFATGIKDYPLPEILDQLYRQKYQFAFSVGFIAYEVAGNVYTKSELIEFSPVLIGADAKALLKAKTLLKQKGIDSDVNPEYNGGHMLILKEVLLKELSELNFAEIKFLRENVAKMTDEEKTKFKEVLETESTDETDTKIAKAVSDAMAAPMAEVAKALEAISKLDVAAVKDINLKTAAAATKKDATPQVRFLHYVRGLQSGNFSKYLQVSKDVMDTTDGDTSVLLPPVEFIAEVERLEEQYGVARRFANIRKSTSGSGIKYLQGADDLEIFFTDEAGVKKSTKLAYAQKLLAWRKAAGILPITDELTEDSAIDLWADATARFARAFTKTEDQLVFTQTTGSSPINPGIMEVSGVKVITLDGVNFADLTYDNLVDMIYGVPTMSETNGRFYFHREILAVIMKIKDEDGNPIWQRAMADGTPATILGKPYEVVEVLPNIAAEAPSKKFMAFGDLRYVTLAERTGLVIKIFDSGSVGDPDEEDQEANTVNLLTQDMQAMRAVKRLNAIVRFPAAFSVAKTAASES